MFGVTRIGLFGLAYVGQLLIPHHNGSILNVFSLQPFVDGWSHWDGGWYLSIVEHGYSFNAESRQGSVAFFPLYPGLIWLLTHVVGNAAVAGLAISNLCYSGALVVLYRLVAEKFDRSVARRTLLLLIAFPFALFYSALYTESLFLLLAVSCFLLAEHERWWLSGAVGLLAALTRNLGIGLAPAIFLLYLQHRGFQWRKVRWEILAPGLVPLGSAIFMAYLYERFGDPLAFATAGLYGWPRTSVFLGSLYLLNPLTFGPGDYALVLALNFVVAILWLLAVVPTARLLGLGYAFFVAFATAVPFSTGLDSLGRYVSILFPTFVCLAYYLRRPLLTNLLIAGSAALLGLFTVLYANSYWII
jgi:hypothetical protein